jgi:hypothetical protein
VGDATIVFGESVPPKIRDALRRSFEESLKKAPRIESCMFDLAGGLLVQAVATLKGGGARHVWFNLQRVTDTASPSAQSIVGQLLSDR